MDSYGLILNEAILLVEEHTAAPVTHPVEALPPEKQRHLLTLEQGIAPVDAIGLVQIIDAELVAVLAP